MGTFAFFFYFFFNTDTYIYIFRIYLPSLVLSKSNVSLQSFESYQIFSYMRRVKIIYFIIDRRNLQKMQLLSFYFFISFWKSFINCGNMCTETRTILLILLSFMAKQKSLQCKSFRNWQCPRVLTKYHFHPQRCWQFHELWHTQTQHCTLRACSALLV